MILDRVTITGADDSVDLDALVALSERFPFVEWGILLSTSNMGSPRFPSRDWLSRLAWGNEGLATCGHLCGSWVRDIAMGGDAFEKFWSGPRLAPTTFARLQLNFHAARHAWDVEKLVARVQDQMVDELILQFDGVNHALFDALEVRASFRVAPLFDLSGGAGVLPAEWPKAFAPYCGYAGGLSPENLEGQLALIAQAAGPEQRVWIDVETHVRSPDDKVLDLAKVRRFLEIAAPHITAPAAGGWGKATAK